MDQSRDIELAVAPERVQPTYTVTMTTKQRIDLLGALEHEVEAIEDITERLAENPANDGIRIFLTKHVNTMRNFAGQVQRTKPDLTPNIPDERSQALFHEPQ